MRLSKNPPQTFYDEVRRYTNREYDSKRELREFLQNVRYPFSKETARYNFSKDYINNINKAFKFHNLPEITGKTLAERIKNFKERLRRLGYNGSYNNKEVSQFLREYFKNPYDLKRYSQEFFEEMRQIDNTLEDYDHLTGILVTNGYKGDYTQESIREFMHELYKIPTPPTPPPPMFSQEFLDEMNKIHEYNDLMPTFDNSEEFVTFLQENWALSEDEEFEPENVRELMHLAYGTPPPSKFEEIVNLLQNDAKNRYLNENLILKITLEIVSTENDTKTEKIRYIPLQDIKKINELLEQLTNHDFETNSGEFQNSDPVVVKIPDIKLIKKVELRNIPHFKQEWTDRRGSFFPYTVKTDNKIITEVLKRCQIFHEIDDTAIELLKDTCLIYALKQVGVSEEITNQITNKLVNLSIKAPKFKDIFEEYNLTGNIKEIKANGDTRTIVNNGKDFEIILYKEHYFVNFDTGMTATWVNEVIKNPNTTILPNYRRNGNRWIKDNLRTINSLNLIKQLFQLDQFKALTYNELTPISYENKQKLPTYSLEYNAEKCTREITMPKQHTPFTPNINKTYFADFETDTSKDIHLPFMNCCSTFLTNSSRTFINEECGKQLLDALPDKSIVYFHNTPYDINFIMQNVQNADNVRKGTRTISSTIKYNNKMILIKDFYTLVPQALSTLPKFFKLSEDVKKEKFPYKYYTIERVNNRIGIIDEAYINEVPKWTEQDVEEFKKNIEEIPHCKIDDKHFDMIEYAKFYCLQDVRVLRESFRKCRELMNKSFKVDIINFLTTPAISDYILTRDVLANHKIYAYGGIVKDYLSKAIYGGRCMCAYNKQWHILKKILDLDACSLYAAAMARMFIPKGIPKVLTSEQCNKEFLKTTDFYVVTIHITEISKHRAFSVLPQKSKIGIDWNDYLPEGGLTQEFSTIFIEDLETYYPGIKYEVLRGYYWNEGKDYTIQSFIKNIYKMRGLFKLIDEPINEMYKLILNSIYGKTIQKFITTHEKIISFSNEEEWQIYYDKHHNTICDMEQLSDNLMLVKLLKDMDNQFSAEHIGIIVLDMSKRIMNEVMTLAEDIGVRIYYQDTDSMHIEQEQIDKLATAFKQKYNRDLLKPSIKLDKKYTIDSFDELDAKYGELVVQELGKFHDDFKSSKGKVEYAVESIFIRKKMYIDKLKIFSENSDIYDYQYRMKGIPQQTIENTANGDLMGLYKRIYNGENIIFNLLETKAHFKQHLNYTISTVKQFTRTASSVYDEGTDTDYG